MTRQDRTGRFAYSGNYNCYTSFPFVLFYLFPFVYDPFEAGAMAAYPRMDPYKRSRFEEGVDAKIVVMGNTGSYQFYCCLSNQIGGYIMCMIIVLYTFFFFVISGVGKTSLLQRYTQNKFDRRTRPRRLVPFSSRRKCL